MALDARSRKSSVASEWYSTRNGSDLEESDVEIREELVHCGLKLTRSASSLSAKDGADEKAETYNIFTPKPSVAGLESERTRRSASAAKANGHSNDTSKVSEVGSENERTSRSASRAQGEQEAESLLLDAFQGVQPAPGEGMNRRGISKAMRRCSVVAEFFSIPEVMWKEGGCLDAVDHFLQDRVGTDDRARLGSLSRLAAVSNSIKARSTPHSDECLEMAAAIGTAITSLEMMGTGGQDDAPPVDSEDEAKCVKLAEAFEEFNQSGQRMLHRKSVAMAVKQCVVVAQLFGFLAANEEVDRSLHMQLMTSKDVPNEDVSLQEFVARVRYARGVWHKAVGLQSKTRKVHERLRARIAEDDTNSCAGHTEPIFVGRVAGNEVHPAQETDRIVPRTSQGEEMHSKDQHVPRDQQQQQQQPACIEEDD